jgi:hypothetical protein
VIKDDLVSTIDVVENFMTANRLTSITEATGLQLWELGEEVRLFAQSYDPPPVEASSHPIYIGGWPSANFWNAYGGPLVSTSLLFAGQVVVKDPIIDWFGFDRYQNEHLMGSRQGFLRDDMLPDIFATRQFLGLVVPSFLRLAPLVRSGAIILIPGEATVREHKTLISGLTSKLEVVDDLTYSKVCAEFAPHDLTVDDTRRGGFVLSGGEKETQLARCVRRALTYFAREYTIANSYGAQYAAPWPFEQYLCERGLLAPVLRSESQRVVQAVWTSQLPIFANLTPAIVRDVREDDNFSSFRAALFDAYRGLSSDASDEELRAQVAEAEAATLTPWVERAEKSAKSGTLARVGVEVASLGAQMGNAFLMGGLRGQIDGTTPVQGATAYLLSTVLGLGRDVVSNPAPVFLKLARHQRKIENELPSTVYQAPRLAEAHVPVGTSTTDAAADPADSPNAESEPAERGEGSDPVESNGWSIEDQPSMRIKVTSLFTISEKLAPELVHVSGGGDRKNRNQPCNCGSGRKWKVCCRDVPGSPISAPSQGQ